MGLTQEEYDKAIGHVSSIKSAALKGEGENEEFLGVLHTAYGRRGTRTQRRRIRELTEVGNKREAFGILEQHFRLTVDPKLTRLKPRVRVRRRRYRRPRRRPRIRSR